jgi:ferredoxin
MAIIITDECINCGACEPECPNNALIMPSMKGVLNGDMLMEHPSLGRSKEKTVDWKLTQKKLRSPFRMSITIS